MSELSVIVLAHRGLEAVRPLLRHLREQTVAHRLEVVVVCPNPLDLSELQGQFARVIQVQCSLLPSSAVARAAGVRAAASEVVAFVEDHSFPLADWAERLLARYAQGSWSGVGPVVLNGNPSNPVSWLNFLAEYGDWAYPHAGGELHHIPGHNSSYRREVLLSLGERLADELEAESTMQWRLQASGHRFFLEPLARVRHYNFSRLWSSLWLRFYGGWLFAANRQSGWPGWRRWFYLLASPLIPLVRLVRVVRACQRLARTPLLLGQLPVFLLLLAADAAGEAVGYATALSGPAMAWCSDSEFDRPRYMSSRDRELFPQ